MDTSRDAGKWWFSSQEPWERRPDAPGMARGGPDQGSHPCPRGPQRPGEGLQRAECNFNSLTVKDTVKVTLTQASNYSGPSKATVRLRWPR